MKLKRNLPDAPIYHVTEVRNRDSIGLKACRSTRAHGTNGLTADRGPGQGNLSQWLSGGLGLDRTSLGSIDLGRGAIENLCAHQTNDAPTHRIDRNGRVQKQAKVAHPALAWRDN
jgi:hypothetical protein